MSANAEQEALLAAIFAHPEEDTPRLVYADWLDEHGEAEQAAFIRVQIELSHKPDDDTRKRLVKRENEVWNKLKKRWADLLAPPALFRKEQFRRGFVIGSAQWTCTIPLERFLALAPNFWPRLPIRKVQLTTPNAFPPELLDFPYLRRLTNLELLTNVFDTIVGEEFALRLFSCDPFDRLTWLCVNRVALSRPVVDALRTAPYLHRLIRLVINYLAISDNGRQQLGSLNFPPPGRYTEGPAKEPGGAADVLAAALAPLENHLVVVPPGETSSRAIVEHTHQLQTN